MRTYHCPECCEKSVGMRLIDTNYLPTEIELEMRPDWVDTIGRETLMCKCGRILTWYQMICKEETYECGGDNQSF